VLLIEEFNVVFDAQSKCAPVCYHRDFAVSPPPQLDRNFAQIGTASDCFQTPWFALK
jgi:hypothetical protein